MTDNDGGPVTGSLCTRERTMFLSATRIEKNKAAGRGVAGRRMVAASGAAAGWRQAAAQTRESTPLRLPPSASGYGVLARAWRRYVAREKPRIAA
jgi:hypothetical protein